jgi:hypothetical protein
VTPPGCFNLRCGAHRVAVFDPRPDPFALGARYVHGGYIAAWWHGEQCLTARPQPDWDPYVGQGLPEVFEYPLGRDAVQPGEEFLRIGAGRLRKDTGHWPQAGGQPSTPVTWAITDQAGNFVTMSCRDQLGEFGYLLTRSVTVHHDGIESRTALTIQCPWSQPVYWFAHPFFAHRDGTRTALHLPAGVQAGYRLTADGGFGPVTGIWGHTQPLTLDLDGGGKLQVELNRPLDKLIVFATRQAFSVEPYIARAWHNGEAADWSIRYRLLG